MGKNKALAHHTYTYFHTRRVICMYVCYSELDRENISDKYPSSSQIPLETGIKGRLHGTETHRPHTRISLRCRGRGGGGYSQLVHGCGHMTIDPRIPTIPGRSPSGSHQPGIHCSHQTRSAVGRSANCKKGKPHPSKNRSRDGLSAPLAYVLLANG